MTSERLAMAAILASVVGIVGLQWLKVQAELEMLGESTVNVTAGVDHAKSLAARLPEFRRAVQALEAQLSSRGAELPRPSGAEVNTDDTEMERHCAALQPSAAWLPMFWTRIERARKELALRCAEWDRLQPIVRQVEEYKLRIAALEDLKRIQQ